MKEETTCELAGWLRSLRAVPDMRVEPIPFATCEPWRVESGRLCRPDGRFFALSSPELGRVILEQPEVGLLAFVLVEEPGGPFLVVHAKDEPGNMFLTQLSPTIQATRSNFERVHGGRSTPMLQSLPVHGTVLSDSLHSEHAAFFWRKRNRNVLVRLPPERLKLDSRLRMFPVRELLDLMLVDHTVNTDARSVLATAPWDELAGGCPFARQTNGFGALLRESYQGVEDWAAAQDFLARHRRPHRRRHPQRLPLDLDPTAEVWGRGDRVRFLRVTSSTREVATWCQPIHQPAAEDRQTLLCRPTAGGLQFHLRVEQSEALPGAAEFAPTLSGTEEVPPGETVAVLHQTDEGGRFWQAACRYEIRLVDADPASPGTFSVNLRQLQRLTACAETTTNELRTLVSMLLYWL